MQISEHQVRECAYFIWENEGRRHGQAAAHWLQAEAELRASSKPEAVAVVAAVAAQPVKAAAPKAAAPKVAKVAAPKDAASKAAAPKTAAAKPAAPKPAPVKAAAKPAAPKSVRASKVAVTAGLAAKAKPARNPAAMH